MMSNGLKWWYYTYSALYHLYHTVWLSGNALASINVVALRLVVVSNNLLVTLIIIIIIIIGTYSVKQPRRPCGSVRVQK